MKNLAIIILALIFSYSLAASADKGDKGKDSFHHGFCSNLKLSSEQKAKMKEALFNFKSIKIDLKANLEKSKLTYEKLVSNPKTTAEEAKAASEQVSDNLAKLMAARIAMKNQIAFEILTPEQRPVALKCEMHRKHHWHHRKHHDEEGERA
jgi:Spy/CpxP family protein refolding chaperone